MIFMGSHLCAEVFGSGNYGETGDKPLDPWISGQAEAEQKISSIMIKRDLPETRCGWRYKNQILDKMHETDISIRRQAQVADVTLALQICCFSPGLWSSVQISRCHGTWFTWWFTWFTWFTWFGKALNLLYALCRQAVCHILLDSSRTAEQSEFISNGLGKFCPQLPYFYHISSNHFSTSKTGEGRRIGSKLSMSSWRFWVPAIACYKRRQPGTFVNVIWICMNI